MKKILLLLISFTWFLHAQAQSYEMISAPDTIYFNPADLLTQAPRSHIKNISGATDDLYVRRKVNDLAPGHTAGFSWGLLDFAPQVISTAPLNYFVTIQNQEIDSSFSVFIIPDNRPDTTRIVIRFFSTQDTSNFLDHSYVFIPENTTSISQDDHKRGYRLSLPYPNPAEDFVWIDYQLPAYISQATLRTLDMHGRTCSEQAINPFESRTQLHTESLVSGAYFIQLMAEGRVITTSKLYVK